MQTGRFSVIAKSDLRQAIQDSKKQSFEACYDQACQIELGREVSAQAILSTQVTKLGKDCEVTLTLYALREAATLNAATGTDECNLSGVRRSLRAAAYRLAGIAPKKKNLSIRFKTVDLPVVEAPEFSDKPPTSLDIGSIDVDALELYDAAIKIDKNRSATVDARIAAWQKVRKRSKKFRKIAGERIRAWKRYKKEQARALAAKKRFEAQRDKDFNKLSRLLKLSVVSESDKKDWAVAFVESYGGYSKNPHFKDPLLNKYVAKAAWPDLEPRIQKLELKYRARYLKRFLRRHPNFKPASTWFEKTRQELRKIEADKQATARAEREQARREAAQKKAQLRALKKHVNKYKRAKAGLSLLTRNLNGKSRQPTKEEDLKKEWQYTFEGSLRSCKAQVTSSHRKVKPFRLKKKVISYSQRGLKYNCSGEIAMTHEYFLFYFDGLGKPYVHLVSGPKNRRQRNVTCSYRATAQGRATKQPNRDSVDFGLSGSKVLSRAKYVNAARAIVQFCRLPKATREAMVETYK